MVKNCGLNNIFLVAQNGDYMDLCPGDVRATYVSGELRVENRGEKSVRIEFDFFPLLKR